MRLRGQNFKKGKRVKVTAPPEYDLAGVIESFTQDWAGRYAIIKLDQPYEGEDYIIAKMSVVNLIR